MPQQSRQQEFDQALDGLLSDITSFQPEGDFNQRTTEGVHALVAALISGKHERERLAAGMLSDVAFFSRLIPFFPRLNVIAEPVSLLLLAANAITSAGEIAPGHYVSLDEYREERQNPTLADAPKATPQNLESSSLWQTTGGLVAGAVARIAKNSAEKKNQLRKPSRWGVRAVIASNIGYSAAAYGAGARPQPKMIGIYTGIWAAGVGAAMIAAKNNKVSSDMVPTVVLGGAATATTAALTSDESVFRSGSVAARGASHGANVLFATEAMTFARALLEGQMEAKSHKRHVLKRGLSGALGLAESTATFLGHLLLADGLNRR
ncbi:hypothetical protein ACG98H_12870 [Corynebacterium sp. L4756]|uniref:hypothetical protein n=1 Tax=unclassified Corynebacterium TaxID=2624378 RepID=UPI00374D54EA